MGIRKNDAPDRLWMPTSDWERGSDGGKSPNASTAPFVRASWASDAWDGRSVEYARVPRHRELPEELRRGTINCSDPDVQQVAAALADACHAGGLSDGYYRVADDALKRLALRLGRRKP